MGQHCALLWPFMQSHRGLLATRRGYCPNMVKINNMADTQMPPMMAASTYRMNV